MYFKLQINGQIGNFEQFSMNVAYDVEGELVEDWVQTTANDMAVAAASVSPGPSLLELMRPEDSFVSVRLEGRRDADDALLGVAEAPRTAGRLGTGTGDLPPQSAAVISLRTDAPGASGRGRIYWPATGLVLENTLRIPQGVGVGYADDAAQYFSNIETAMENAATALPPWSSLNFAVRSKTTKTTPHVVRIQVGDVVDTQRRRRDAMPETYWVEAYPPA